MGDHEKVDPSALRALASRLESTLTPLFEQALAAFEEAELNGPAFSNDGLPLQAAYPGTRDFALRDLQTKAQKVESIIERLNTTAETWETAEHASTATTR